MSSAMSIPEKKFIVFIVVILFAQNVTGNINYDNIRNDDQPFGVQPEHARTSREILEMFNNWAIERENYTLQEATEHLLQFGALMRIHILDTFGTLVYDHYDDYSIGQTEALYRVYQETLERKYNIFDIVPSVLANSDMRPTKICRHIHKHVHTCLKESSLLCTTIRKHDHPHPHTSLLPVVNVTRRMYKSAQVKEHFPNGFSLPAILKHLKAGSLALTVNLVSGLLHNVQYDSFDDEVRTAERNVMVILTSEMLGENNRRVLTTHEDILRRVNTVSELLKELFERRKTMYDREKNKNFAILADHVVREVEAISRNIELLGTVYENDTIDMKYLFNLVLPPDVVHGDVTEAKDYLLQKISDYDIVRKYLKVEKYQQSGPDQLLMEILGQMRDVNFAVDLATALHVHARFWHQSHMINNLNELLELFDAYENLRNVPEHSDLMGRMNKIRNTLWDSKNVTIEISCNDPRACLRLGLETVAQCPLINSETKNNIHGLFRRMHKSGAVYTTEESCQVPINRTEVTEAPQTSQYPMTITEEFITDLATRKRLITTELSTVETTSVKSDGTPMPTTNGAERTTMLATEETTEKVTTVGPTTTMPAAPTELFRIMTEDTTTMTPELRVEPTTEIVREKTTETTEEEQRTTPVTIERMIELRTMTESTTETQTTGERLSKEFTTEELTTTKSEPMSEEMRTQETTTTTNERSATEAPTTNETIDPRNSDDCSGDKCTTEPLNESTETLPSDTRNIDHSSPPPLFSDNMVGTELPDLWRSATAIPTTTEVIATPTLSPERGTTLIGKNAGLSKKPKTYSTSSSGEDCSGESCSSEDCSSGGCSRRDSSTEETTSATDCSGTNCNMTSRNDCENDGSCASSSSGDTCGDSDCKSDISDQDCPGGDCPSTPGVSVETKLCQGGECSTPSPECIDDDCAEVPKSNESTCTGDECHYDDERGPHTTTQRTDPALPSTVAPLVRCDNKDPHHQRKLDKLRKIRIINAIYATATIPTALATESISDDDSSNESRSLGSIHTEPIREHLNISHPGMTPWMKFSQDEIPKDQSPGHPVSVEPHEIKNKEFDQESIEADIESAPHHAANDEKLYRNSNTNVNFINLRRYLAGGVPNVSTPSPITVHKVHSKKGGHRRVLTQITVDPDSGKNEHQKSFGNTIPDSDIPRRRMISSMRMNPVIYQKKRSEDDIERVRKHRSIIRAPQKVSRRYRAL